MKKNIFFEIKLIALFLFIKIFQLANSLILVSLFSGKEDMLMIMLKFVVVIVIVGFVLGRISEKLLKSAWLLIIGFLMALFIVQKFFLVLTFM